MTTLAPTEHLPNLASEFSGFLKLDAVEPFIESEQDRYLVELFLNDQYGRGAAELQQLNAIRERWIAVLNAPTALQSLACLLGGVAYVCFAFWAVSAAPEGILQEGAAFLAAFAPLFFMGGFLPLWQMHSPASFSTHQSPQKETNQGDTQ